MRIGCHAVLFTDKIVTETDHVLEELHQAGAEGVEIGARFFGLDRNPDLKNMLDSHEMMLSGLHVSIKLTDVLDHPTEIAATLKRAAAFLQVMPDRNIIMTGLAMNPEKAEEKMDARLSDPDSMRRIASRLDEIASGLKGEGVQLNYHNHSWEFENDGLIFFTLADYALHIHFALDTGWAAVSGYDPIALISRYPGRFHYVHLRDFDADLAKGAHSFMDLQQGFVEIGEGDMDIPRLMVKLNEVLSDSDWAVIEYEKGAVEYARYARAVTYLRTVLENL